MEVMEPMGNILGKTPLMWVVVPCYNEEEVLPLTMPQLEHLLTDMVEKGLVAEKSRIVYVDDCSKDGTWDIICKAHEKNPVHCGLHLGRNSGHQNALLAGMEASLDEADCTVTIDADLQDDIGVIPEMVRRYREGCEVVYGVRNSRSTDTPLKRWTALGFYRLMGWMGAPTVFNHADFRLMGDRAVAELMEYGERTVFLRGIVPQLGYSSATVRYDRRSREAGETKYPMGKMLVFAMGGITSMSVKPIRLVLLAGLLFIAVALCVAAWVFYTIYMGRNVAGWASLMLSLWFVGGCILTGLGIIGEYIGSICTDVRHRPRYNVTERRM